VLTIDVRCKENDQCVFEDKDLFLDITITNSSKEDVGFPLSYLQQSGPIIRLVDVRTSADAYLETNPADQEFLDKFTAIHPGRAVTLEWVIMAHELQQFGQIVDVRADVTIMAKIRVAGKLVDFKGTASKRITSKTK